MNEDRRAKAIEDELKRQKEETRLLKEEYANVTAQRTDDGAYEDREKKLIQEKVEIVQTKRTFQAQADKLQIEAEQYRAELEDLQRKLEQQS